MAIAADCVLLQNSSPCRICSMAIQSNSPEIAIADDQPHSGYWMGKVDRVLFSISTSPSKITKGRGASRFILFLLQLEKDSRSRLWRVKWPTAPILHLRGFASILPGVSHNCKRRQVLGLSRRSDSGVNSYPSLCI